MRQTAAIRYAIGCAMVLVASRAAAQGTLSAQGFGYPPGELSAYARSLGGAAAETDPLSPINPAALMVLRRGGLYLQSEQESRSIDASGNTGSTRAYRFPLFSAAVPVTTRGMLGVSFSTMLDRTWGTESRDKQVFGADSIAYTERFRSEGALNDVRIAGAWAIRENIVVGLGLHLFPGENRLTLSREFEDSLSFAPLRDSANVNYSGTGLSGGVMWRVVPAMTIGASGRVGGTLKLRESDSVRTKADAPSRFGVGVRYDVSGTVIAFRADRTLWSRMGGLGSSRATPQDTWDLGLGVDAVGPRILGAQVALRAGARRRELPFLAGDESVRETAFTFGAGSPLARGRASVDLFLERAGRKASGIDANERSWTLGLGLTVRP
jgi:hypothetical protein